MPRQPDLAAMRKRRDASQPSLHTLKRERGLQPASLAPAQEHIAMSGASDSGRLTSWLAEFAQSGVNALNWVFNQLPAVQLGPIACDAASTVVFPSPVNQFKNRYSTEFEIHLNAVALSAQHLAGMIVVIGEDHVDDHIQQLVRWVMRSFDKRRGDRLFKEGNDSELCAKRIALYGLRQQDCRLLEIGSQALEEGPAMPTDLRQEVKELRELVLRHLPSKPSSMPDIDHLPAVVQWISDQSAHLPRSVLADVIARLKIARQTGMEATASMLKDWTQQRDSHAAKVIRQDRTRTGLNYVIVGAAHLQGLSAQLKDLPCIFMLPKSLAPSDRNLRTEHAAKDEL